MKRPKSPKTGCLHKSTIWLYLGVIYSILMQNCGSIAQKLFPVCENINASLTDEQSIMDDNFDNAIHEVVELFEKTPTTEDTRTGIDRRHAKAEGFPLKDNNGEVVAEDRRTAEDRRNAKIDIDDISEYDPQLD